MCVCEFSSCQISFVCSVASFLFYQFPREMFSCREAGDTESLFEVTVDGDGSQERDFWKNREC